MDFKYVINEWSERPIMLINDTIGGEGINGGDFQKELLILDSMGKNCIEIMINSPGGSVFDGFSIASAILNCKTHIVTNNVGIAGSIAGVIYMCAKERLMEEYALLMMHNVSGGNEKSRKELNNSISLLLSNNSSLTQDQVKDLMKIESWINYEKCVELGFCTEEYHDEITQEREGVVFTEKYAYNEIFDYANNIINKIDMKKEKAELNDVEQIAQNQNEVEVSESNIEIEVNENEGEVSNESEVENEAVSTPEEEITNQVDLEGSIEIDYQNLLDEKDVLIKTLEAEISRMKLEQKQNEVNNFIDQNVEIGKISEDTKNTWVNLCMNDFESTKEVINSLKINKVAPQIENNANSGEKKPQSFLEMINFRKNK